MHNGSTTVYKQSQRARFGKPDDVRVFQLTGHSDFGCRQSNRRPQNVADLGDLWCRNQRLAGVTANGPVSALSASLPIKLFLQSFFMT